MTMDPTEIVFPILMAIAGVMLVVSLNDKVPEKVVQNILVGLVLVCVINLCQWAFGGRK